MATAQWLFSQLIESTFLFTSVNPGALAGGEVSRWFTGISRRSRRCQCLSAARLNLLSASCLVPLQPSLLPSTAPQNRSEFLNDFAAFLTHLSSLSPNIILLGDFNIHMDNINLPLTKDFTSCLECWMSTTYHFPHTIQRTHSGLNLLLCCHPFWSHSWWTTHNWPFAPVIYI